MDRIPNVCQSSTEKLVNIDMSNENVSSDLLTSLNSIPNERGFKMAFLNIVTLPSKIDEIRHSMCSKNIDLIAFNETRLDLSISDGLIHLDGYEVVRKDRSRNGGGVCIYLRSSINYKIRSDLIPPELEAFAWKLLNHKVNHLLSLQFIDHQMQMQNFLTIRKNLLNKSMMKIRKCTS